MNIAGQVALIAGGASGLGRASALALAQAGARVAILDVNEPAGRQTARRIDGLFIKASVASAEDVRGAFDALESHFGAPARIILNAAALAASDGRLATPKGPSSQRSFERLVAVNVTGGFNMMSLGAHAMMTLERLENDERGVIVNVASIAAEDGPVGTFAYAATKAAVAGMTLPGARDLAPYGIRVVCLLPGAFDTPMLESMGDEARASAMRMIPFPKRAGDPAEFANFFRTVVETPMLNGANIRLDAAARIALI
jgi:NAD(P)-dependent dehydrogenase (short-subunit alcohol dehydrogenase family)